MGNVLIFNIVDKGSISQGMIVDMIVDIFKIEMGFQGQLISIFVCFNLDSVVDDVNDEIFVLWVEFLIDVGIMWLGLLFLFMEKELFKDMDLSMDGG